MSLLNLFKAAPKVAVKLPTTKEDAVAYANGAKATYSSTYNTYMESVESLDKAVRAIANIASMAKFKVSKEVNSELKPYKIKNVDFLYNVNDQDSANDLIGMMFASIFAQGAAIIIPEINKKTKMYNFFAYDVSRFKINATENSIISSFEYTSEGGNIVIFKPEDLIYIAPRLLPNNLVYATSRLKPLQDMLQLQADIMGQTTQYYASGGKNSAIISPKEPMGAEKAQQLTSAFNDFLKTPATKTLYINTEVDVTSMSNVQSPLQVMQALTIINQQIIQQFGIPEYIFGNYQGYVNDAAVKTAARVFFQVHMKPVFKSVSYQWTRYFRNTMGLRDAIVDFNFDDIEILEDSLEVKIENATKLYKLGVVSMNEARVDCERKPLEYEAADRHMVPSYLTGQYPVSIEQFDETLDKLFASNPVNTPVSTGATGGADNQALVTDSTGGPGNLAK